VDPEDVSPIIDLSCNETAATTLRFDAVIRVNKILPMKGPAPMTKTKILSLMVATALAVAPASAENAKTLKTKKGMSVALVNLLNAKPDCSSNAAPISVPIVREKPTNGNVQMLILVVNVAAAGNCQARKVPVITLIYTPKPSFIGEDSVTIEIENGNRTTSLSYIIAVQEPGETL
jgi:hypothetical protein